MKFLDSTGLGILWNKIKSKFLPLEGGGTLNLGTNNLNINSEWDTPYISINGTTGRTTFNIGSGGVEFNGETYFNGDVYLGYSTSINIDYGSVRINGYVLDLNKCKELGILK